jgi:ABC-type transport system involved in multi-copper enzyme maturation permease subunit
VLILLSSSSSSLLLLLLLLLLWFIVIFIIAIINAFVSVLVESNSKTGSAERRGQTIFSCTIHSGGRIRAKQPVREMIHVATLFGVEGKSNNSADGQESAATSVCVTVVFVRISTMIMAVWVSMWLSSHVVESRCFGHRKH